MQASGARQILRIDLNLEAPSAELLKQDSGTISGERAIESAHSYCGSYMGISLDSSGAFGIASGEILTIQAFAPLEMG